MATAAELAARSLRGAHKERRPFTVERLTDKKFEINIFLRGKSKHDTHIYEQDVHRSEHPLVMANTEIMQELPWFVVQLRPHGLKRALDHLQRQNFPTFAPMYEKTVVRSGTSRQTRAPLFPGYIFVRFEHENARWTSINSTRGVSRIISPTPLPKQLIGGIMARCDESGLLAPPATLAVGDEIRVISGPFAEIITTIETLPDQARIGVLIDLMGRKVRTSLPRDQIEKL